MAQSKKKFTSPIGVAVYPRLNKPDTKFDAAGVYKTNLALPADAESTKRLVAFLQKRYDDYVAQLTEANKGRKPKMNDVPFEDEFDKDGNATGNILFKFSSKASGVYNGKPWERKIKLFDAKGNSTTAEVWGGSQIKVSFTVGEYKAGVNCGIKCYLEGVQVIELVSGSGGSASDYGFGEEDGYEDDGSAPSEDNSAPEDNGPEDGADF